MATYDRAGLGAYVETTVDAIGDGTNGGRIIVVAQSLAGFTAPGPRTSR
jgi:hypothetical protein